MSSPGDTPRRFRAFISYRHLDNAQEGRRWAEWLHHSIETYRVPEAIVGRPNRSGEPIPATLYPVFRDEEEISASRALGAVIEDALLRSDWLVVLCSPRSASSPWVEAEVRHFQELGRGHRILRVLIEGQPGASVAADGGESKVDPDQECLPPSLRPTPSSSVASSANLFRSPDPLMVDFRPFGGVDQGYTSAAAYREALEAAAAADGSGRRVTADELRRKEARYSAQLRQMRLKLLAGLLDIELGELTRRDAQASARRLRRWLAGTLVVIALLCGLLVWAVSSQRKAATNLREAVATQANRLIEERRIAPAAALLHGLLPHAPSHDARVAFLRMTPPITRWLSETPTPRLEPIWLHSGTTGNVLQVGMTLDRRAFFLHQGLRPTAQVLTNDPINGESSVAFLASGDGLVASPERGLLRISAASGALSTVISTQGLSAVRLLASQKKLALGWTGAGVALYDNPDQPTPSGRILLERGFNDMSSDASGTMLAVSDYGLRVQVWDLDAGNEPIAIQAGNDFGPSPLYLHPGTLLGPEGRRLAVTLTTEGGTNVTLLYELPSARLVARRPWQGREYLPGGAVSFSTDGNTLLLVGGDRLTVCRSHDGSVMWEQTMSGGFQTAVLDPAERYVVASDRNGELLFYDLRNGTLEERLPAHGSTVGALSFSPNGDRLTTLTADGEARDWSVSWSRPPEGILGGARGTRYQAAWDLERNRLLASIWFFHEAALHLINTEIHVADGTPTVLPIVSQGILASASVEPRSGRWIVASEAAETLVYDTEARKLIRDWTPTGLGSVRGMAVDASGRWFAALGRDAFQVFDVGTGKPAGPRWTNVWPETVVASARPGAFVLLGTAGSGDVAGVLRPQSWSPLSTDGQAITYAVGSPRGDVVLVGPESIRIAPPGGTPSMVSRLAHPLTQRSGFAADPEGRFLLHQLPSPSLDLELIDLETGRQTRIVNRFADSAYLEPQRDGLLKVGTNRSGRWALTLSQWQRLQSWGMSPELWETCHPEALGIEVQGVLTRPRSIVRADER